MSEHRKVAGVTGGTGTVGQKILNKLIQLGYEVRVLTRNYCYRNTALRVYYGDIENLDVTKPFLKDVDVLFHCAAELKNEKIMWQKNVYSCKQILEIISSMDTSYFCYFSSAGVVGITDKKIVDEETNCNPQSLYEKSKREAEQLILNCKTKCNTAILRPTNIIDDQNPGILLLPIRGKLQDRLHLLLKGNERAHIIHAEDVADAAIHLMNFRFTKPEVFFVSCDHEKLNTVSGLWSLYRGIKKGTAISRIHPTPCFPIIIPFILRRLMRGPCNWGDVCYSSNKLISTGFRYNLGIENSLRRIVASQLV
jgi:nucleoside-diphosphate-sugar epimerase